ncbi:MAG TPA: M23 family metallopeptidase [Longimicrobium sp.]|jgi:murein DD-endopeptidase MepM/ murein hydrolase activator NlpD|uniref:M23 family metallopeptidase n=1 Tax=Longimicrobium sp. TaxID=2029185 RepID=UPI002ED853A9
MSRRTNPAWRRDPPSLAIAVIAALVLGLGSVAAFAEPQQGLPAEGPPVLAAVRATPATIDTLLIGGFARGTFREALNVVASDLSEAEREMVGRHLDRIFVPTVQLAMQSGGRLKVAYERVRRPDGSTRSIQVLAAQAAVGGGLHTLFFYEHGEKPGYYDDLGQSLDPRAWAGPLAVMHVTSGFRMDRMHPILRRVLPHTGIDYAAAYGTPVRATADGSVSFASVRGGYGNLVEVQHPNGYATRYAHLSRIDVRPYQPVRQGDVIGYVGATGLATGPHLHYEVRRKGQPVDPALAMAYEQTTESVGYDLAWRNERRALARLIARTPTVIRRQ